MMMITMMKRYWSSLFDVFAPSYLLITNMPVATEDFFSVTYILAVLSWSWS